LVPGYARHVVPQYAEELYEDDPYDQTAGAKRGGAAVRRSEPVPIGVAIAEAYAAIGARRRTAARQLRRQASETLRKARATG